MRASCLALVIAAGAAPASAQEARLPPSLLGTWAPEAADCIDRDGVGSDARVGVAPITVHRFASSLVVRRWRRTGEDYRARAVVHGEGEEGPEPGTVQVVLRLRRDGRLQVRVQGEERGIFVRCPPGVEVR